MLTPKSPEKSEAACPQGGESHAYPPIPQPLESGWIVYGLENGYNFLYPHLLRVKMLKRLAPCSHQRGRLHLGVGLYSCNVNYNFNIINSEFHY